MLLFPLRFQKQRTFIQVGAHTGDDSLIAACRRFGHNLFMFEPNPKRVDDLEKKAAGAPNIHVIPMAVSNYNGKAKFHIACHDDCSSLQQFDADANRTWVHDWHPYKRFEMVDQVEVDVIRLDTFLNGRNVKTVDLLEIDAQGEDLRVVESLGERTADVKSIQIEVNISGVPLYDNSFSKEQAVNFFSKQGFQKHVSWKQSLNREENMIFRNRRFYSNGLLNSLMGALEQYGRAAYMAAVKLPRVIAVTRMVLRRKMWGTA
jgi:FkbM family methyltransferase